MGSARKSHTALHDAAVRACLCLGKSISTFRPSDTSGSHTSGGASVFNPSALQCVADARYPALVIALCMSFIFGVVALTVPDKPDRV